MKGRWLLVILLAALALRLGLLTAAVEDPRGAFTPDSYDYTRLADRLLEAGDFRRAEWAGPETFRAPGYPLFLLLGAPYGDQPARGLGWRYVLLAQVALDVLLVGLTYVLGRLAVSHRAGVAAAAFQAAAPVAVAASCRVLSDSVYAFLLTAGLVLFVRHLQGRGRGRTLMACAAVLAVACTVRPVGLVMAGLLLAVLLIRRHRLIRAGPFAVVLVLALMPWFLRNIFEAGYYGFSSFAGDSAYAFWAPAVLAEAEGIPLDEARRRLRRAEQDRLHELVQRRVGSLAELQTVTGAMAHWRGRRAAGVLLSHPLPAARVHLAGCAGFWLPGATDVLEVAGVTAGGKGTLKVLHRRGPWAAAKHYFGANVRAMLLAVGMGLLLPVKLVAGAGWAVSRLRKKPSAVGWVLFAVVVVAALLPGVAATPRFRVPVAPILSVAAGAGLVALVDCLSPKGTPSVRRSRRRPTD